MPTTSAVWNQKTSSFLQQSFQHVLKSPSAVRARFLKVAALSFAVVLPVLGVIDPAGIRAASLATGNNLISHVSHNSAAASHLSLASAFATGGIAVVALAGVMGLGYLRRRKLEAAAEAF